MDVCPYSKIEITEFMQFWIYDKKLPILKVSFNNSTKNEALFSYTYLCSIKDLAYKNCSQKAEYNPQFAIIIRNAKNEILQIFDIMKENTTKLEISFDMKDNLPYFVKVYDEAKFVVQYENENYDEFLNWFRDVSTQNGTKLPPYFTTFVLDMYQLALRNVINLEWLFEVLQKQKQFSKAGILDLDELSDLESCLEAKLFSKSKNNEKKLLDFCNFWSNKTCSKNMTEEQNVTDEMNSWYGLFGEDFKQVLLRKAEVSEATGKPDPNKTKNGDDTAEKSFAQKIFGTEKPMISCWIGIVSVMKLSL